jgi:Mg2+-importing ATPase
VADESDLILLGYIAFLDPPKGSAAKAIASLKQYGVATKILTGDNALVTRKICKDVDLDVPEVITGDRLVGLDDAQLGDLAEKNNIFARLSPSQKESIIIALQKRGHVVGYMGDGINDAPSMRVADVGISVDTAVDVAKESADIILLEKSLLVLEDGIIEGRKVFNNIVKYIRMGASSNFGNMFSMTGSSYLLKFFPMTSGQIILNNFLYDFSQLGIPWDNVDHEYVLTPRKWDIANIRRFMVYVGPVSSIFDYATFAVMLWFYNCIVIQSDGETATLYQQSLFHTAWFVESIVTQTMIVHIIRTRRIPFFQSCANPVLLFSTFAIIAIGSWLPFSPLAKVFGFVPLPPSFWWWLLLFIVLYSVITHNVKVWYFKKFGID